jgi:hypothetical protein
MLTMRNSATNQVYRDHWNSKKCAQEVEWLRLLTMKPDENRIEGDKKTTKASGPEVVDEEIYLIPGRYKWGKKPRKRRAKTEGWHSFKAP